MATPAFVLELREQVGTALLFLPAAGAVVLDDAGRVLLQRRADSGAWALPAGYLEPGEQPADGAVREVREETGIVAVPERLTSVHRGRVTYENGDTTEFVTTCFRCRAVGGVLAPDGEEATDARFFALDELPDLPPEHREMLANGLSDGPAQFLLNGRPQVTR